MATVINNPPAQNDSSGPVGMIIVLVIVVVLAYLGYVYGLPAIRQMQTGGVTPQINVPSDINVNVKTQ